MSLQAFKQELNAFGHRNDRRVDSTKGSLLSLPTKRLLESRHWVGEVPRVYLNRKAQLSLVAECPIGLRSLYLLWRQVSAIKRV